MVLGVSNIEQAFVIDEEDIHEKAGSNARVRDAFLANATRGGVICAKGGTVSSLGDHCGGITDQFGWA